MHWYNLCIRTTYCIAALPTIHTPRSILSGVWFGHQVSTTATGKEIWAAAVREVDNSLADGIMREKDWRHQ